MIPADLLNQLREKDPELWEKWTNGLIGTDGLGLTSPYSSLAEAWLQHCLQEAIRARGWGFSIGRSSKGMTSVSVYVPGGDGETIMDYDEAEALGWAYLAAL